MSASRGEDREAPPTCYVCLADDPPPPRLGCACRTNHAHVACLLQVVERRGTSTCSMCATPDANVIATVAWEREWDARALTLVGGTLLFLACYSVPVRVLMHRDAAMPIAVVAIVWIPVGALLGAVLAVLVRRDRVLFQRVRRVAWTAAPRGGGPVSSV